MQMSVLIFQHFEKEVWISLCSCCRIFFTVTWISSLYLNILLLYKTNYAVYNIHFAQFTAVTSSHIFQYGAAVAKSWQRRVTYFHLWKYGLLSLCRQREVTETSHWECGGDWVCFIFYLLFFFNLLAEQK